MKLKNLLVLRETLEVFIYTMPLVTPFKRSTIVRWQFVYVDREENGLLGVLSRSGSTPWSQPSSPQRFPWMTGAWGAVNIICDSPSVNQSFQSLDHSYGQFVLPSLSWILFLLCRLHELYWIGGRLCSKGSTEKNNTCVSLFLCFFLIQPKETETNRKPKPHGSIVQVAGGGAGSETCSCDIWMDRTNRKEIATGVSTVTMQNHAISIQERLASESKYIHRTSFGPMSASRDTWNTWNTLKVHAWNIWR